MNATHATPDFAKAAAVYGAKFHLRPIPVTPGKKAPPMIREWQHKATTDTATIASWWQEHPAANVALCPTADQLVIDIDGEEGHATLRQWEAEHGALPESWVAITATQGEHRWFRLPAGVTCTNAVRIAPGIDIRTAGGYVVAPPSVRDAGQYHWETRPGDCELAMAPDWLVELVRTKPEEEESPSCPQEANGTHPEGCPPGILRKLLEDAEEAIANGAGRNKLLFDTLVQCRDNGATKEQAELVCRDFLALCERHPRDHAFEPKEARATLASVFTRAPRQPWEDNAVGITIATSEADKPPPQWGDGPPADDKPEPWGPPHPLEAEPLVPPLPAAILAACPDWLLDTIVAASESFELPEDLAFMAAMAALSTVALGAVTVRSFAKHPDQPANFYGMATGRPGAGKSSVLRTFTGPLDQLEADRLTFARRDHARAKASQAIRAKRKAELERKASRGDSAAEAELLNLAEQEAEEEAPPPRSRLIQQSTPEGIATVAAANRGQFSLTSAEPQALAEILGSYRDNGPRLIPEVILSGFDGAPLRQARATEGKSRELSQVHGTLLVFSQRDQLDRIIAEATFRESGFMARNFLSSPPVPERSADPFEGRGIPDRILATYADQLTQLGKWLGQFTHPGRLTYSREALEELAPIYAEMKTRRDTPGGDLFPLAISLVRVEQIAARIGALVHVAREGDRCFEREVPGDIGAALVPLAQYHAAHGKALLGGQSPAHKLAKRILQFTLADGGAVEWRALHQSLKGNTLWDHAEEAFELLRAHNLCRVRKEATDKRPRRIIEANPELLRETK